MDMEKMIKRSAEDNSAPPSKSKAPQVVPGSEKYTAYIEAIDTAGLLPTDWLKVNMYDYEDRHDVLVNFYVKDPTQDPMDLIDRAVIVARRIIDDGKTIKVERT
jgi:hypothetical protein